MKLTMEDNHASQIACLSHQITKDEVNIAFESISKLLSLEDINFGQFKHRQLGSEMKA